jgi:hypothetical protein
VYLLLRKLESFAASCLINGIIHFFEADAVYIVLADARIDGVSFALASGALGCGT